MGIKSLFGFLREKAPKSIEEKPLYLKHYVGRAVAVDASMHLYQFLAAVRTGEGMQNLANANGEATSHIQGFANRTLKMLEMGVKPIFVFDGASPRAKEKTLRVRSKRKREAEEAYATLPENASREEVYKAASATTRVSRRHNDDVKVLLRYMGVSVVDAPGEAEATCARLAKAGLVYAAVTEDMDALTFGAPVVIKNLFDVEGARTRSSRPAYEINLDRIIKDLKGQEKLKTMDMAKFVDFCILCGCDYLEHLAGVGPATAFKLLDRRGDLESAVVKVEPELPPKDEESFPREEDEDEDDLAAAKDDDDDEATPVTSQQKKTKKKKAPRRKAIENDRARVSPDWDFAAARRLFLTPDVAVMDAIPKPPPPDYENLVKFLVDTHGFNADRVDKMIARLKKCKASKPQQRLDAFLKPTTGPGPSRKTTPTTTQPKAKAEATADHHQQPEDKDDDAVIVDPLQEHSRKKPPTAANANANADRATPRAPSAAPSTPTPTKRKPAAPAKPASSSKKAKLAKPNERITNWFKPPPSS